MYLIHCFFRVSELRTLVISVAYDEVGQIYSHPFDCDSCDSCNGPKVEALDFRQVLTDSELLSR